MTESVSPEVKDQPEGRVLRVEIREEKESWRLVLQLSGNNEEIPAWAAGVVFQIVSFFQKHSPGISIEYEEMTGIGGK